MRRSDSAELAVNQEHLPTRLLELTPVVSPDQQALWEATAGAVLSPDACRKANLECSGTRADPLSWRSRFRTPAVRRLRPGPGEVLTFVSRATLEEKSVERYGLPWEVVAVSVGSTPLTIRSDHISPSTPSSCL
jgi:hypothetical protein